MLPEVLRRRCSLGLELRRGSAEVVRVAEEGTAGAAGVLVGDRLLAVNGESADAERVAEIGRLLERHDPVTFEVERRGKLFTLEGTLLAAPLERVAGADVRLGNVVVAGGDRLRTITTVPVAAAPPFVTVLFLQGLGHGSCELGVDPDDPRRKLIEELTALGLATVRIERSGTGDSEGPPASETDLFAEMAAYRAWLDATKGHRDVDVSGIILFGQSVGGMIAPFLAGVDSGIRGVAVFGTSARKWSDIVVRGTRKQRLLAGASEGPDLDLQMSMWTELHTRVCRDGLTPAEVFDMAPHLAILEGPSCRGSRMFGREVAFYQQLERLDLAGLWRTTTVPVLVMNGEYDWVCEPEEGRRISETLTRGTFLELPQIGHDMLRHESLEKSFKSAREGTWDGAVIDAFTSFLPALL
jgi:pimeloyl-ACP methyl ester carboxylesterase